MDNSNLLVVAMGEECRQIIEQWEQQETDLPESMQRPHLLRMCQRIEQRADDWPATRLHRWIGYIQCALIANGVIDLAEAKRMFDRAKIAYPESDEDLVDHLDPTSGFELDIGGLG